MVNKANFLARVSIFSILGKTDLERIAKQARHHLFHDGEVIIREGDHDKRLFIVLSGEVEVIRGLGEKNERCVRTLGPYSYFGEMALIDDLARSATVVAKKDTGVLSLDHWDLRKEIEKHPGLAFEMLQMLSQRIRAIERTMKNRLGTLLPSCANCRKIREENGSWTPIEVYIEDRYEAEFTHGICPECAKELYPQYAKELYP